MIEDIQLRGLFKTESAEHLQVLDDALLRLEKSPANQALIEEAFRAAHSLKGASRMLGLNSIQAPARQIEEGLNAVRRGATPLTPESIARMANSLGTVRTLIDLAISDTSSSPPAAEVSRATKAVAMIAPPADAQFRIDSVRVDTRKLDTLMTHAGELMVTRTRVARRLAEFDALIDAFSEEALLHLRASLAEDSARLDFVAGELESGIRLARLLPLSMVFAPLPRLVHDLGRELGKEVELVVEGGETTADKRILEEIKDPLMHLLRNAIDHGIEAPAARELSGKPRAGRVRVKASRAAASVSIDVSDDGRGLDETAIGRAALNAGLVSEEALTAMSPAEIHGLILRFGLSTAAFLTDISGRGVGMGVVRANVERLRGQIALVSAKDRGTSITLRLPLTLSTARVLVVTAGGHPYGLPVECVSVLRNVHPGDVFAVEGRMAILHDGRAISVAKLTDLLELADATTEEAANPGRPAQPCVVLTQGGEVLGVTVDSLLEEQEVVLKPQGALLGSIRNVAGAAILDSGKICMVLEVRDLLASAREHAKSSAPPATEVVALKRTVLLVEDSLATRVQEARILEGAGYAVVTATDGLDAFNKLATRTFAAVVTDVNMPNLDGFGLTERIRAEPRFVELPIVLVTSLSSDEDRRRGLDAGANAYITKEGFDQAALLACLERLIG